jgi:hypothetical protein
MVHRLDKRGPQTLVAVAVADLHVTLSTVI